MSLISHLYHGELGEWCADRLTGWKEASARITLETREREALRPTDKVDRFHWAQVDRAFGIRVAALVQSAPPYSALHGLVKAGLVSRTWADGQAALYPTHAGLPESSRHRALDLRPTPSDEWLDLRSSPAIRAAAPYPLHEDVERRDLPAEPMLADLFERMRSYFAVHAPVGQIGAPGAERGVARLCWLLGLFEYVYRNDKIDVPMYRLFRAGVPTIEQLHAVAEESAVKELAALTRRLQASGTLAALRQLAGEPPAGTPWGIARPVFVDHWADSDIVINGPGGGTLLDVTTAISTNKGERSRRWIWKLLACAWLDTADSYHLRTVGLYFARHGVLITWQVEALADLLLEGADQARARREFRALAERLRAEERQAPPIAVLPEHGMPAAADEPVFLDPPRSQAPAAPSSGPTREVSDLLEQLRSPDLSVRQAVRHRLYDGLLLEYDAPVEEAADAVPLIYGLLLDPSTPERYLILKLLADLATGDHTIWLPEGMEIADLRAQVDDPGIDGWREQDREAYDAVRGCLPGIRQMLTDPDLWVRVGAAYVLGWFPEDAQDSLPLLHAASQADEPELAATALISIGLIGDRFDDTGPHYAALYDDDPASVVRWGAAVGLAILERDNTDLLAVEELQTWSRSDRQFDVPFGYGNAAAFAEAALELTQLLRFRGTRFF